MAAIPIRFILWLDCGGGLLVGTLMWALGGWLQPLFRLPPALYTGVTAANLAYGAFALVIALHRRRSVRHVATLAVANALWGCVCLAAVIAVAGRASVFGLGHLIAEGAFVVWLAGTEWRHRTARRLGV
jgi:hypothetical protein